MMEAMRTLITPAEVVAMAFGADEYLPEGAVGRAVILSAQQKFIKPALGEIYGQMLQGRHAAVVEQYIKAPLALYVKWLMMPAMAVGSGAMGVVRHRTDHFEPADAKALSAARRRVKGDAKALMRCALEYIAADPQLASLAGKPGEAVVF